MNNLTKSTILVNGNPVNIYMDNLGNYFVELVPLCQALGVDPGTQATNMADAAITDPQLGTLIPAETLARFTATAQSTIPEVNDKGMKMFDSFLHHMYATQSAGAESATTTQQRHELRQKLQNMDAKLKTQTDAAAQLQTAIDQLANAVPGENVFNQTARSQKRNEKIKQLTGLNAEIAAKQLERNNFAKAMADLGDQPNPVLNYLGNVYGKQNVSMAAPVAPVSDTPDPRSVSSQNGTEAVDNVTAQQKSAYPNGVSGIAGKIPSANAPDPAPASPPVNSVDTTAPAAGTDTPAAPATDTPADQRLTDADLVPPATPPATPPAE